METYKYRSKRIEDEYFDTKECRTVTGPSKITMSCFVFLWRKTSISERKKVLSIVQEMAKRKEHTEFIIKEWKPHVYRYPVIVWYDSKSRIKHQCYRTHCRALRR